LLQRVEVVAGPATGGALLAHTLAGLLDSRRSLSHPACLFAPFHADAAGNLSLRDFYRAELKGREVLLADDVRNTGGTLKRCAALVREAGGVVVATVQICDRLEALSELDVPNVALAEYKAPENYRASDCPLCKAGQPITRF
jgi:orotate phosphoribosyltransferase